MKITYKIVPIVGGTFELFKQVDGVLVRTMGNFDIKAKAEKKRAQLDSEVLLPRSTFLFVGGSHNGDLK